MSAERTLAAPIEEVWQLCATERGLEGWWGAEDVITTVEKLDLRVGGEIEVRFEYAATANNPRHRAEFEQAGIPTSYRARGTFLEVLPFRVLAVREFVDFGPRTRPTEFRMRVELHPGPGGVRVALTAENTPSAHWRTLGRVNLVGQLGRMARLLGISEA
jgi:uncharacterized protein YndB with AHSA1/START domain